MMDRPVPCYSNRSSRNPYANTKPLEYTIQPEQTKDQPDADPLLLYGEREGGFASARIDVTEGKRNEERTKRFSRLSEV